MIDDVSINLVIDDLYKGSMIRSLMYVTALHRTSTHIVVGLLAAMVLTGGLTTERPAAQAAQGTGTAVTALTRVRIAAAGASVQIPAGATSLDLTGKTVMPGMINAHAHVQHQTKTTTCPRAFSTP